MFIPRDVILVEVQDSDLQPEVHPEELATIEPNVVERRRKDFLLGRHCAREALETLGAEAGPILCGVSREPIWPNGVCGSITHCADYCAAAVAWQANYRSIGIDAEPLAELPREVVKLVATEAEIRRHERAQEGLPWDLLMFSAKESVFKAWFPLMRIWLGFEHVEIEFTPASASFRARISPAVSVAPGVPREFHGKFEIGPRHVFTCAFV